MKKLLFLSCLLYLSHTTFATHIIGGSLTYVQLNDSTYTVSLKLYRDCSGGSSAFPSSVNISVRLNNGTAYSNIAIPLSSISPVLPNIDSCVVVSSVCMEEGVYTKTVNNLHPSSGGYHLYFQYCCRNSTLLNVVAPVSTGDTWYVHIPGSTIAATNSSPQWAYPPPLFVCQGNNMMINQSATDTDGDSLVYSLFTPYSDQTITYPGSVFTTPTINWSGGYGANNPLNASIPNSLTINANGILMGVPPNIGTFLAGIKCEEWRGGVKVGEILRDFQFKVASCPAIPVASFNFAHSCSDSVIVFNNTTTPGAPNYFWDFGNTSSLTDTSALINPSYTYPAFGNYTVSLISNPGTPCADTSVQILNRASGNPSIYGSASFSGGPINFGKVKLFSYAVGSSMLIMDSTFISTGNYSFSNVIPGNYIVLVEPDTLVYPLVTPTYYPMDFQWDSATVISVGCGDSISANVVMIELPMLTGGGVISGSLMEGPSFMHSLSDPIAGISVGLEREADGILKSSATTNSVGQYIFKNLPPDCYKVFVNIPGLVVDSTYHVCITGNDTIGDLDFYADSNHVYINNSFPTSVSTGLSGLKINVYPNPFNSIATIEFSLKEETEVRIEVVNLLGEKKYILLNEKKIPGNYSQELDLSKTGLVSGIYLLRFQSPNETIYHKIIFTK